MLLEWAGMARKWPVVLQSVLGTRPGELFECRVTCWGSLDQVNRSVWVTSASQALTFLTLKDT